jgi:hypothetical protein
VYRRLNTWAIIFFLASLLLFAVFSMVFALFSWMRPDLFWLPFAPAYLGVSLIQGVLADSLLRQKALRAINQVRRTAPDEPTAVRALSGSAPRGAQGGYAMHGLLMLVGVPAWGLGVLTGTRILSPAYSESQSVHVALMRTALRDVSVMQENHFLENGRYTDDIETLGYDVPDGVSILVTASSDSGWSATATHALVARSCIIFVGRVPTVPDGGEEGVPFCPGE